MEIIINCTVKIITVIIFTVICTYVVPWLKDKKLYSTVVKFVYAAEKYAKKHSINKKEYVIGLLQAKGIAIDCNVEALIESAVEALDIAIEASHKRDDSVGNA